MNRFFLWIFIVHFATGHNPIEEVLRLPILLSHFEEHKNENAAISFFDFLYLHYADEQHEDSDNQHEDLPLHCHHGQFSPSVLPCLPSFIYSSVIIESLLARKGIIKNDNFLKLPYLANLLRPPALS